MFYTDKERNRIQNNLEYLSDKFNALKERVEQLEITSAALLKTAVNNAKQVAEQSSVTVTVHAPHGLKKDGTPKKKPGPAKGSKR